MTIKVAPTRISMSPTTRGTTDVQRTLRVLIWFGLFLVLGVITLGVSFVLGLVQTWLGMATLAVGGLFTLTIPGMVSRCLYVVPEYKRLVLLKMGKFIGVKGPGKLWVIPYPPYYQSVAAQIDTRVRTRIITAAQSLTADNVPVGCEAVIFWRVEDP